MRFDAPESSEEGSIFPSSPSMDRVVNNFRRSGLGRGAGSLSRPPFLLLLLLNFTSFLLAAPPPPTTLREKFVASAIAERAEIIGRRRLLPSRPEGSLPILGTGCVISCGVGSARSTLSSAAANAKFAKAAYDIPGRLSRS